MSHHEHMEPEPKPNLWDRTKARFFEFTIHTYDSFPLPSPYKEIIFYRILFRVGAAIAIFLLAIGIIIGLIGSIWLATVIYNLFGEFGLFVYGSLVVIGALYLHKRNRQRRLENLFFKTYGEGGHYGTTYKRH